jgi:hypothetical protein
MSSSREPAVFQRHQEAQGPALLATQRVRRLLLETCLKKRTVKPVSVSTPKGGSQTAALAVASLYVLEAKLD